MAIVIAHQCNCYEGKSVGTGGGFRVQGSGVRGGVIRGRRGKGDRICYAKYIPCTIRSRLVLPKKDSRRLCSFNPLCQARSENQDVSHTAHFPVQQLLLNG
jgi:hypothetical protein